MMNNELKKCPFCGSKVNFERRNRYGKITYIVICQNDLCFMRLPHNRPSFENEEKAITSWNGRAKDDE